MDKIKEIISKYKNIVFYLFFGVCTTLINWLSYYLLYSIWKVPNVISTIIAWIVAVIFAFVTNKIWVFDSKSFEKSILLKESASFVAARLVTGLLDVIIMYVAVDLFFWNSMLWKLLSNFIVIVINYVLSKFLVFSKR